MARRRLTPPFASPEAPFDVAPASPSDSAPPRPMPPIARMAGQSAAEAALATLAEDMHRARAEGRLVLSLPLEAIDADHLVRDRIALQDDDMAALQTSLRARGQQTPIEVVDLGEGRAPARYGLISGWRRLTALRRLRDEDPGRFGMVLALLRRPDTAADAYRAMVEENEIRAGLSYYERARIAARAAGQGVFADVPAALSGLFGTASRAKRSKIGSFVRIHAALDDCLRHPAAIPERLGLDLARALEEAGFAAALRGRLATLPLGSRAADEQALLVAALRGQGTGRQAVAVPDDGAPDLRLDWAPGRLVLSGAGVTADLASALRDWLAQRAS